MPPPPDALNDIASYSHYIALCLLVIVVLLLALIIFVRSNARTAEKQAQAQIDLLAQIAAASGVSKEKVADLVARERIQTD